MVPNSESRKYAGKEKYQNDIRFTSLLSTNGNDTQAVLKLLESGRPLIEKTAEDAAVYYLAISLLDFINNDLRSLATDIMLYAEEKDDPDIPKTFSSIEDIKTAIETQRNKQASA